MANGKKKSKKKIIIIGVIVVLLFTVVGLVAFGGNNEVIVSVQTEDVVKRNITQVVSATGKINPVFQVIITPEVTGEIVELPVEEGDDVKKGQLLLRIKPDIYIAQKNRAEASLKSAEANLNVRQATLDQVESEYKRVQGLYDKGLASDSQLEQAKANYLQNKGQYESQLAVVAQASESLKEAQENLAKTAIYSPINGTVSALNVELSERVLGSGFSQGTNMLTVADLDNMEATVDVDENDVVLISVGDTAEVEIDAFGDEKFLGTVTQIGNSAKVAGLGSQDEVVNFEVKIKILHPSEKIRPGMSCDSDIKTETKNGVLTVPIQSVTARQVKMEEPEEGEKPVTRKNIKPKEVVFIVDGNKAKKIEVKTGISDDTYIEIIEGLTGDEKIISGPYRAISKELQDSTTVTVSKGKEFGVDSKN